MRHKVLTLAVVALLAFGASGVSAASIDSNPSVASSQSPADDASPANYTVEVVDPNDRLSEQDVENARQLAWANETVNSAIENGGSAHFHVEAVGDELQVYVAPNRTAAPRVQAVVDLGSESVDKVEELNTVLMADEMETDQLATLNVSNGDAGETRTVKAASGAETITADEVSVCEDFNVAVESDGAVSIPLETADSSDEHNISEFMDCADAAYPLLELETLSEND